MPYIKQEKRKEIDPLLQNIFPILKEKGDYNYVITTIIHNYIKDNGLRYSTLNDSIGIVECVKQELYRMIVSPYEDIKIKENGEINIKNE